MLSIKFILVNTYLLRFKKCDPSSPKANKDSKANIQNFKCTFVELSFSVSTKKIDEYE